MMKHNMLTLLSCIALLSAALPLAAQTGIDSKVEVTRDYEGKIMKSDKSLLDTRVADSLYNFKLNFDYSTFYRPYSDLYEFSPQLTADPFSAGKIRYPWLYVRLGASYPLMPLADVYISPRLGKRFSFTAYFNHDSFWGKLPYADKGVALDSGGSGNRMVNRAGAALGFRWNTGELSLDAEYSNSYYTYRDASNPDDPPYHYFNNFRTTLALRSTNPDRRAFYYDVDLSYRYLGDDQYFGAIPLPEGGGNGIVEHSVDVDASFGATFKYFHKIYLNVKSVTSMQDATGSASYENVGKWVLAPTYKWEKDRWRLGAGLAVSSLYGGDESSLPPHTVLYPEVNVDFEAARNAFWLYTKIYGEQKLHTLYNISLVNPWFDNQSHSLVSYIPISAELGFRGAVKDRFSYGAKFNYSMVNNMLSFYANGVYQSPLLTDNQILNVGAFLRWKSKDFYAAASFDYRYFTDPNAALMIPAFDLNAEVEYNIRKRVFFNLGCYFRTSTVGAVYSSTINDLEYCDIPAFVDLEFRITWAVNDAFSVFVEADNLTNSKIQYFINYIEPGVNAGGGICLKF